MSMHHRLTRLLSFRDRLAVLWARRHVHMAAATLDDRAFADLKSRARGLSPSLMDLKYFDTEYWLEDALRRAYRLDIPKGLYGRILDIGTGFGYFPYICEYFGHTAHAIDREGHGLYDAATGILGLTRRHHTVTAFQPVATPDDDTDGYDLITAFQIAFDRPTLETLWGADDWDYFIRDMLDNRLRDGGRLHLELNYIHSIGRWYKPEVTAVFKSHGAKLDFERITITKPSG